MQETLTKPQLIFPPEIVVRSCILIITLSLFYMNTNESCSTVLKTFRRKTHHRLHTIFFFFINVILHLYRQLQQSMQTRFEWLAKQSIYKHLGYFSIHTLSSCHSEFELDTTAAVRYKRKCILQLPPLPRTPGKICPLFIHISYSVAHN